MPLSIPGENFYIKNALPVIYRECVERVKEHVGNRSYGKEDTVKETQEGCLSRPIRIKSAQLSAENTRAMGESEETTSVFSPSLRELRAMSSARMNS